MAKVCTASGLVGCRAAQPREQCIVAMSQCRTAGGHAVRVVPIAVDQDANSCSVCTNNGRRMPCLLGTLRAAHLRRGSYDGMTQSVRCTGEQGVVIN